MGIRGLKHLVAGQNVGGISDRESLLAVDENYLLEALNLTQIEKGVWATRNGFTELTALVSPTGESYTSQFDYQNPNTGRREHLGVIGKTIVRDGSGKYTALSTTARGRWIFWSIANIAYYFNGKDIIRYDGDTFRTIIATVPSTIVTGTASVTGSLTAGDYRYKVTFVSDVRESLPSTTSAAIAAAGSDGIDISSIPTGPIGTVARNIYRTGVNGTVLYFYEQTINNNFSTTARSTIADSSLGAVVNEEGGIPLNYTGADIYNDHLMVWGVDDYFDTLFFSVTGKPETFEPDDFIDFAGKTGDVTGGIIRGISYRGRFYVFRQDIIHVLMGNNRDDFITSVNSIPFGIVGAIAQDSFQIIDGFIYFLSEDGPYVFDGVSAPRYIGGNTPAIWDPYHIHSKLNQQQLNLVQSVYYRSKKQWWLAVPERNQTKLSAIYVYHHQNESVAPDTGIRVGAWSKYESALFIINDISIVEGNSGNLQDIDRILLADASGSIFEYDTSQTDNGTAVSWRWTSIAIDFGMPYTEKRWWYFTPFISEAQWGSEMTVDFLFDGLGLDKKVFVSDLGSDIDASALYGQMLWNGDRGYWTILGAKPVIKPISIDKSSNTLHVMMRGSTRVKIHGYDVAGVPQEFRDHERGTIRNRIRV